MKHHETSWNIMKHHLHVARGFKFEAVCLADQSPLFCPRSETQKGAVVHLAEVPSAEVFLMGALQREAGSSSAAGAPAKNLRSFDNLQNWKDSRSRWKACGKPFCKATYLGLLVKNYGSVDFVWYGGHCVAKNRGGYGSNRSTRSWLCPKMRICEQLLPFDPVAHRICLGTSCSTDSETRTGRESRARFQHPSACRT